MQCRYCEQEPHKDLKVCCDYEEVSLCQLLKKKRLLNILELLIADALMYGTRIQ